MNYIIKLLNDDELFRHGKGIEEDKIIEAQQYLGVHFADSFKQFLLNYGGASYEEHEFAGLIGDERTSVVCLTKEIKEKNKNISPDMYVIEQTDYDDIVLLQDHDGKVYYVSENNTPCYYYDTLEEYLLSIINENKEVD